MLKASPRASRRARRPRASRPVTRAADFTSNAVTTPSWRSTTRSTSWPSWVRQWPTSAMSLVQDACLRSSPTTNVSSRCPNSLSAAGSSRPNLAGLRPSSRAATPLSRTWIFGAAAVRARSVRSLTDSGHLDHIAGQGHAHVVVDPAAAGFGVAGDGQRQPAAADPFDVVVAARHRATRTHQQVGSTHRRCEEVLDATVELSLRERQQLDHVDATGQGLRGTGQRVESGRAGYHEPAGLQTPIQLGLLS